MRLRVIDIANAIQALEKLAMDCDNLNACLSGRSADGRGRYLDWAHNAESQLRGIFADPAVTEEVFSSRFWRIAEGTVIDRQAQLLTAEIQFQVERLRLLTTKLRRYAGLRERPGAITVLDTNVLLHYQRIDMVRWSEVVGERQVRLVIPLLVLDELDDKRYLGQDRIRERARMAVAPLDDLHGELEHGFARLPDDSTVEYLVDDEGHRRRDNPDEEILDRAEFLHIVTGQPIRIVTGDRGLRVRATARSAGVVACLMPVRYSKDQAEAGGVADTR